MGQIRDIASDVKKIDTIESNVTQLQVQQPTAVSQLTNDSGYQTLTQVQTRVDNAITALVDSAPGTLNTLNELAAALGDDPNFATSVTNMIAGKANLSGGTFTGNVTVNGLLEVKDPGNYYNGHMRVGAVGQGFPYVNIGMDENDTDNPGMVVGWYIKALGDIITNRIRLGGVYGQTGQIIAAPNTYEAQWTTIKTVNGTSILGAGDIVISAYADSKVQTYLTANNYVNTTALNTAISTKANLTDLTPTNVSDKSNTSTGYFSMPKGTLAQRPSGVDAGDTRFNTTANAMEVYTGSAWSLIGAKDGSSFASAATSATAIWDLGIRGKGLFWVQRADGTPIQVYCDLDTLGQDGKGGWMLVGSWATASEWTKDSTSSSAVFGSTALNCFSSNFGNANMQHMRVKVATSIDLVSASSDADFYYYWSSPVQWKTVWAAGAGVNNHYNSGTVNAGGSVPRNSLRQFSYAYNLKFGYTANYQVWANLSDSGTSGPGTGSEEWRDWYSGLTTPGITLGANMRGDGSLAICFGGDTSTGAGQDTNNQNAKYGYDDTGVCAWGGTTGINNMGANTGAQGNNTNLWMWIK